MQIIIITIPIALIIATLCIWKKPKNKVLKYSIIYLHLLNGLLFIVTLFLLSKGYQFNGQYTNSIIALSFVSTAVLVFGVATRVWLKVYSGFFFVASAIFEIALLFAPNGMMLFYAIALYQFQPAYLVERVNTKINIECYDPFLGPPPIYLTEEKYGILKKRTILSSPFKPNGGLMYPVRITVLNISNTHVDCYAFDTESNRVRDTLEIR